MRDACEKTRKKCKKYLQKPQHYMVKSVIS
jgi:hypothetical protein